MTEKRFCKDCKYTKGIGYDFWCGKGHTEHEAFFGETNCPYYEYHDWSKGTPKTENKRFKLISDCDLQYYDFIEDNEKVIHTSTVVDLLNKLNDENKELKNLLKSIADRNGEIWLDNGQIIRLK